MKSTRRIGPRMRAAAEYVKVNPGCTKLAVAEFVGPHSSRAYGYQIVNRAIAAGLIRFDSFDSSPNRYYLYPVTMNGRTDMKSIKEGTHVRFLSGPLGAIKHLGDLALAEVYASKGDEGIYEGPDSLSADGWHVIKFGAVLIPAHESMFEIIR